MYPADEWQAIGLNYTSGTTGQPKGVVVHHRGAYLAAIGQTLANDMGLHPIYLWTLPMFHCNGWTFTWAVTLQAGTHVCLRRIEAAAVFAAIAEHKVTHLCGAPIVHEHDRQRAGGGAPAVRAPRAGDDRGRGAARSRAAEDGRPGDPHDPPVRPDRMLRPRHGVRLAGGVGRALGRRAGAACRRARACAIRRSRRWAVIDPATMQPVARDGATIGEIMLRGNTVMKGYLKNPPATAAAFAGDWYHTGDLAVMHEDGYCEVKDRSKDIIISGGENISSIEVEGALYRHPAVLEAAVVARPDAKWGESRAPSSPSNPTPQQPSRI